VPAADTKLAITLGTSGTVYTKIGDDGGQSPVLLPKTRQYDELFDKGGPLSVSTFEMWVGQSLFYASLVTSLFTAKFLAILGEGMGQPISGGSAAYINRDRQGKLVEPEQWRSHLATESLPVTSDARIRLALVRVRRVAIPLDRQPHRRGVILASTLIEVIWPNFREFRTEPYRSPKPQKPQCAT